MSFYQPTLTPQQKSDITNYVNMYRAKNQAPPMVWDDSIATFSQQWSYHMVTTGSLTHSGTNTYGENIAMLQGYGDDIVSLIKKSIDLWYNESALYDFTKPGFSGTTGHFTCLVWKSSTNFGMGISMNNSNNSAYISFNTSPPGNYMTEFAQNVLPSLTPTPTPTPTPTVNTRSNVVSELYRLIRAINLNYSKDVVIGALTNILNEVKSSQKF